MKTGIAFEPDEINAMLLAEISKSLNMKPEDLIITLYPTVDGRILASVIHKTFDISVEQLVSYNE